MLSQQMIFFRRREYITTALKMKFNILDVLSKFKKIRDFLWIYPHLLKNLLMENLIICVVAEIPQNIYFYLIRILWAEYRNSCNTYV